jgi:hypothetical protein
MASDQVKRKLTAILSADVKGYSRLMGEDEEWTRRILNSHKEMMNSLPGPTKPKKSWVKPSRGCGAVSPTAG